MISRKKIREIANAITELKNIITDEQAITVSILFPEWNGDSKEYKIGDRVVYEGILYRVLTEHISQDHWNPKNTPSLFTKILIPDDNIIPNWEQPDSTNPYMDGDKVKHKNKIWCSTIDNNVWEPGVFGWDEIVENLEVN